MRKYCACGIRPVYLWAQSPSQDDPLAASNVQHERRFSGSNSAPSVCLAVKEQLEV